MPLAFAALMNDVLVSLPSSAYTTTGSPIVFSTNQISYLAFDVTVTSFTGGTAPTIQFFIDRLGIADGLWYNIVSSQAFSAAGTNSWDIGPGFPSTSPPNGATHAVLTTQGRFRWVFGGTANPTAVTFSASVIGR